VTQTPTRSISIASLFLLPQCDMGCRFCASEAGFSTMDFDQALGLLLALRRRGVESVVFGGGEPSLWPHGLGRICGAAKRLGFLVQVCTNGVALPQGFERDPRVDRYILPLESADPAVHDRIRRRAGGSHHAIVLERLAALAGSGTEVTMSTVVTRDNVDGLEAIADLLARARRHGLSIHAWHLYRFLAVGRGGAANAASLDVGRGEFLRTCAAVRRRDPGFRIYRRDDMLRSSTVEFFWFEGERLRIGSVELTRQAARGGGG